MINKLIGVLPLWLESASQPPTSHASSGAAVISIRNYAITQISHE
jgi:hypothetical protein